MAYKLYINTQAPNPASALVQSESVLKPVALPRWVLSDQVPVEVYFVDGQGGFESWSGGTGGYTLKGAFGDPGALPTGGTYTLTFGGNTTSALAYNAAAAAIQTAFQALASVGANNATVTGTYPVFQIEFVGTLANTNVGAVTATATSLTPDSAITVSVLQAGGGGSNEKVMIRLVRSPIVLKESWGSVTNGWSGNLDFSTKRLLDAFGTDTELATYIEFQVTDASTNRRTYLQAPIVLLNEAIDESSTVPSPTTSYPTTTEALANYVQNRAAITGLTGGGSSKLDGIVTVGGAMPTGALIALEIGTTIYYYELVSGTDAESSPDVIRPDDYNGATNAVVWKLRNIGTFITQAATASGTIDMDAGDIQTDTISSAGTYTISTTNRALSSAQAKSVAVLLTASIDGVVLATATGTKIVGSRISAMDNGDQVWVSITSLGTAETDTHIAFASVTETTA